MGDLKKYNECLRAKLIYFVNISKFMIIQGAKHLSLYLQHISLAIKQVCV